jgi:hypothetical protein
MVITKFLKILICCLSIGLILCISIWILKVSVKRDNVLAKRLLEDNTPFNPSKFDFVFNNPLIRSSNYAHGFRYCSFKKSHGESKRVDDRDLFSIGSLKVIRSLPATWTELYHDPQNDGACYFLFANNLQSSLICVKYDTISSYLWELSRICQVYSQPIDWEGQNY